MIPLSIIKSDRIVIIMPVVFQGRLNALLRALDIEFACVRLPIPNEAETAKRAKSHAKTAPARLFLKVFLMVYIGPPVISPILFFSLYFIASIHSLNLVVNPKTAESHIHTSAPGPPDTIAVATPTIFPVPIVEARAVVRAEKGDTSPLSFFWRDFLLNEIFSA